MTRRFLIDLRQAARSLARAPGFTAVAVLTLGVGLGLATAIYAALKQAVIDPLPFPDADRLMVLLSEVPGSGTDDVWGASTAQFFHFRGQRRIARGNRRDAGDDSGRRLDRWCREAPRRHASLGERAAHDWRARDPWSHFDRRRRLSPARRLRRF